MTSGAVWSRRLTQRVTQVAWAKKAPRNLGGEVRMSSKRESVPLSDVIREKR